MHRAVEVAPFSTAGLRSDPHLLRAVTMAAVVGRVEGDVHEVPAELPGLAP